QHDARNVEPAHGHDHGRNRLVAARNADKGIEEMTAYDELDRVGDRLATHERGLHAFGAHGNSIGDGDRVELDRRTASFSNAALHLFGQLAMVPVARRDFDPAVGDADQRLREVIVREADRLEEGSCGCAIGAVKEYLTLMTRIECHAWPPCRGNISR